MTNVQRRSSSFNEGSFAEVQIPMTRLKSGLFLRCCSICQTGKESQILVGHPLKRGKEVLWLSIHQATFITKETSFYQFLGYLTLAALSLYAFGQ